MGAFCRRLSCLIVGIVFFYSDVQQTVPASIWSVVQIQTILEQSSAGAFERVSVLYMKVGRSLRDMHGLSIVLFVQGTKGVSDCRYFFIVLHALLASLHTAYQKEPC